MKTSEKVRRIACYGIVLVFLLALLVSCGVTLKNWSDPLWILNDRWRLSSPVPAAGELIFYASDQGFLGDGTVQYVFAFSAVPAEFLSGFSAGRDEETENALLRCVWERGGDGCAPDFAEEYLWRHCVQNPYMTGGKVRYYTEEMYMAYFPASLLLYVCEDLS